ncbi:hypothetical protein M438DRAFT_355466 [Aureobasidium pullulans EXF-150]|uniref:F-box domain-containing protein n=1 Tax=Aureobasidium pullulans EXF-150 TaxID=1043002 RepID=A0A074XGB3_AURPU|nr:uncharacterized protein M438DRAFT_355466 [Aureobasidium pullulans EXF-150]KEQ84555.1 hypothetical protein M438DRAFT_355466 [Aureobasidium pullulans EXF-150]
MTFLNKELGLGRCDAVETDASRTTFPYFDSSPRIGPSPQDNNKPQLPSIDRLPSSHLSQTNRLTKPSSGASIISLPNEILDLIFRNQTSDEEGTCVDVLDHFDILTVRLTCKTLFSWATREYARRRLCPSEVWMMERKWFTPDLPDLCQSMRQYIDYDAMWDIKIEVYMDLYNHMLPMHQAEVHRLIGMAD